MIKAVLFDLGGVLVDSEPISREASDKVLAEVGIVQTEEERKRVFGRRTIDNYRDAIEARGLDIDPRELVERKNDLFGEMIRGKLKPLPGVIELLDFLRNKKIRMAVVSSSPKRRVEMSLGEVKLMDRFDLVVTGDCCERGKPNPEPFLTAAERLGVMPEECLVVEDAEFGIIAANEAGMRVVAVRSPNTFGQDLSKADRTVDSLKDLNHEVLMELSSR